MDNCKVIAITNQKGGVGKTTTTVNKRRAEAELAKFRSTFEPPKVIQELSSDMLFSDYLKQWLDIVKVRVKITTFSSYQEMTMNGASI